MERVRVGETPASMRTVIWGATGQAIVLAELLAHDGTTVEAFFDNDESRVAPIEGVPIFHGMRGFEEWRGQFGEGPVPIQVFVAIGGDNGRARLELARMLENRGLRIATAVHHTAFVARDATVGAGSQILAMSAVAARVRLGRGCIVNTSASIDHECELADGVHVGPGAHLAGSVIVEECAFIGTGAVVAPRVRIGAGSIVGAGSVVIRDVSAGTKVAGNPARVLAR